MLEHHNKGRRRGVARGLLAGVAAGAAGTTALNALTYLDMTLRARPSSSTPEKTVERLSEAADVPIPGDDEDARHNRVQGLAPLTGILAGVGTGAVLGVLQGRGLRPPLPITALLATVGAMAGGNGPMIVLGITDPRQWAASDWISDVVPHLGYGMLTAWVLHATDS